MIQDNLFYKENNLFSLAINTKWNMNSSIHSNQIADVHDVPIDVIIRPISPELDENKVCSLMNTIQASINYTKF